MTRILLTLLLTLPVHAATLYVSPTGVDTAAGTLGDPLSFHGAIGDLGTPRAVAGDTIVMRDGIYPPTVHVDAPYFRVTCSGTLASPIRIQPYTNEIPVIEGHTSTSKYLELYGSNVWVIGVEIRNTFVPRTRTYEGLRINAQDCKVINCDIHDTGVGIYVTTAGANAEIYGNRIWNYGDLSGSQKHAVYTHTPAGGLLKIHNNVFGDGAFFGIHVYGEVLGDLSGEVEARENTIVNGGTLFNDGTVHSGNLLWGGTVPANKATFFANYLYAPSYGVRNQWSYYTYATNMTLHCASNYVVGDMQHVGYISNVTMQANTFLNPASYFEFDELTGHNAYSWDNNTYEADLPSEFKINGVAKTFAQWKTATGFDAASTMTASLPVVTKTFVTTNKYEAGRALLTAFNWANTDNVSFDVSSAVTVGANYSVWDAANYGSLVSTGSYGGGSISLPMTNLVSATPVGLTAVAPTGKGFNVFLLRSLVSTNVSPPTPTNVTVTVTNLTTHRIKGRKK